jgi:cyclophilin family peptidyl-prolyl cis-trans isomerase/HEAT repeat protein
MRDESGSCKTGALSRKEEPSIVPLLATDFRLQAQCFSASRIAPPSALVSKFMQTTIQSKRLLQKVKGGVRLALQALLACALCGSLSQNGAGQKPSSSRSNQARAGNSVRPVADEIMLRVMRAEDERRWDAADLGALLFDRDARVRRRAALAAGRIGDERAVPSLVQLLQSDKDQSVRAMAAFALGETESASATDALLSALRREREASEVRARVLEAIGKLAAATPKSDEPRARTLGEAILNTLTASTLSKTGSDRELVLMGLTAALRAHPANAAPVVAKFLSHADARVRADAANTLARLRAKEATDKLRSLLVDTDAVVRANAARALGVAEDASAFEPLLARATGDTDERVRVSAIRALGSLKDARAALPLLDRATKLFQSYRAAKTSAATEPPEANELLEIATTLGRLLANTGNAQALSFLREFREAESLTAPEIEIALARISPALYLREKPFDKLSDPNTRAAMQKDWRTASSLAQGLGEINGMNGETAGSGIISNQADAQIILKAMLDEGSVPALALPDVLRAFASIKSGETGEALRKQLSATDVIVRATAAELLGGLTPGDANTRALANALPLAMRDELNDASLAILEALGKQKSSAANEALKTALDSQDQLIRRRAVALLQANGAGDFQSRIGTVASRNTLADYERALARRDKQVRAIVTTDKGAFTIELLADDAPLNVDNFVQLARRNYFNGITFHRVVPNFVIQGGDPRGDGNGGPGYQIRCEINLVPYERGAVGMALSGKDTGGSQWFVTHSPQPHLDGGYTVFGRIVAGMNVVDQIARGDHIRSISITESDRPVSRAGKKSAARQKRKSGQN